MNASTSCRPVRHLTQIIVHFHIQHHIPCASQLALHGNQLVLKGSNFSILSTFQSYRFFQKQAEYSSGKIRNCLNLKGDNFFPDPKRLLSKYREEKMSNKTSSKRKVDTEEPLSTTDKKQKLENGDVTKTEDFIDRITSNRTNVCNNVSEFKFNKKRVRVLSKAKDFPEDCNGVVYWMSRDQRVQGTYLLLD